ncbi:GAP family protein [Nocardia sp. NPDC003482]
MSPVLGDLLPLAVGVAISPIPMVAAILVILSGSAARAAGYAGGWVIGIAAATTVFVVVAAALGSTNAREPSAAVSWIKIVLGVLLFGAAAAQWRRRSDAEPPAWMRALDGLSPPRAAGLGALLAAVNPKNLLLCLSAGVTIGTSALGSGGKVVAVVVFTVLAAASVLAVVLAYAVAADRLRGVLGTTRSWLQANNHAVLAIVLVVLGAAVLGKGIGGF